MFRKPVDPDSKPSGSALSRRRFLKGAGVSAASAAMLEGGMGAVAEAQARAAEPKVVGPGILAITVRINGQERKVNVEPRTTLAEALRNELDLTGTTVVGDRELKTIDGLANGEQLHPVQEAFIEHDAM